MFHRNTDGPPCKPMEPILHQVADGSARGWKRIYAIWHARHCPHCGTFLGRLKETLVAVSESGRKEPDAETLARLKEGRWKKEI
jgi:hypothetical protein